jgi:uncharacterized membrane protein YeaQ/YmgE (transglycosylase-associated protein family)
MQLIVVLVLGLVVGALAQLVVPRREPGRAGISMFLGVLGALIGGLLARAFGSYAPGEPLGFAVSLLGAIVLVATYHVVARRRAALGP